MHIGMISTYPPTQCGIATYSSYLVSKLEALNPPATVDVISACGDGEDDSFSLSRAEGSDLSERLFNTVVKLKPDVVHIQHITACTIQAVAWLSHLSSTGLELKVSPW